MPEKQPEIKERKIDAGEVKAMRELLAEFEHNCADEGDFRLATILRLLSDFMNAAKLKD